MLKERLDIKNVEIERAHRAGRKTEIRLEQLFVNSYDLKTNKTFWGKQNFWKEPTYSLVKIIAKKLSNTERNCGKKLKFYEAKEK